MSRLDISCFSEKYRVQTLTPDHLPELCSFCCTNPQYYEHCGVPADAHTILDDMTLLPPGKQAQDKYYVGFYDGGQLTAVLDLIDGYPDASTAYIGFFMVHGSQAHRGIGTVLIDYLCDYLFSSGFTAVRLAYQPDNPQASHFWRKNGFIPVRAAEHPEYGHLVVGEKRRRL